MKEIKRSINLPLHVLRMQSKKFMSFSRSRENMSMQKLNFSDKILQNAESTLDGHRPPDVPHAIGTQS